MASSEKVVGEIWEESRERLKRFIAKRIDAPGDIEDLLQDVFLKIHQNVNKIEDPSKLYAWVFQITRNAIADFYRDRRRADFSTEEDLDGFPSEEPVSRAKEEVLNWLEPMIGELPEKYREAIYLADFQGLKQQEVARRLKISLSGAKSRIQRARKKLADSLQRCCHIEFDKSGRIVEYKQKVDDCGACADRPAKK